MYVVTHVCTWLNTWITALTHTYGVLCTVYHGQIATYWTNTSKVHMTKFSAQRLTDYAKVVCVGNLQRKY